MRSLLSVPVLALLLPTLILAAPLRHRTDNPLPNQPQPPKLPPNDHPAGRGTLNYYPGPVPGKPDPLPIDPKRNPRGQGDGTPQKPRDWKPAQPGDSKQGLSYRLLDSRAPTDLRSKLDATAPPPNKLPGRDDEQAERDRIAALVAASENWIPAPPAPAPARVPKPPGNAKPHIPSAPVPNRRAPKDLRSELDTTVPPPKKLLERDGDQAERDRIGALVAAAEKRVPAPAPPPPARVPNHPDARPAPVEKRDAEGC